MGNRKGRDDLYQVPKRRRCQDQRADEQEMVIAGEDMMNTVVEKGLKQRSATCLIQPTKEQGTGEKRGRTKTSLGKIQLVKRLIVISVLRCDLNVRIAGNKAIDEIDGNPVE